MAMTPKNRIHENSKLAFEEFKTSKLIICELDKLGIDYKFSMATMGIKATGGPSFVAVRADMEVLPIQRMNTGYVETIIDTPGSDFYDVGQE
ncbi:hypothetical protein LguiB_025469 [Lonicera macranthoides]